MSRLAVGELSPTHELPVGIGQPANGNGANHGQSHDRPRRIYLLLGLVVAAIVAIAWLWPGSDPRAPAQTVSPAPPVAAPPSDPVPAQPPPPKPTVEPAAPNQITTAAPTKAPDAKPARPHRGAETGRRKPKPVEQAVPSEVETEWK
jgi:hypothetical protein